MDDYDGTNQIIHLERNDYFDDWSGVTPNFDDIYFEFYANKEGALSALATGAVDMVDSQFSCQLDEIADLPGVVYELVEDPGTQEMGINMEHPYLGTGELMSNSRRSIRLNTSEKQLATWYQEMSL